MSAKNIKFEKNIIFGILLCIVVKFTDNSVIMCDEIIDAGETKTISRSIICETKNFYILLTFLLITIALLTAFSIYFCLIKYKAKQKHLLTYYVINDKLTNLL